MLFLFVPQESWDLQLRMFGYITCGFPRIFGYVLQVIKYSISVPLDRGGFGGWNLMLTLKTSMVTLPPFQTEPRRGPHRQLSMNCFRTTGPVRSKSLKRLWFRSANRIRLRKCLQMCDYFRSQKKTLEGLIPVFNLVLSGHTYFNSANKTTVISFRPHENVSHNRTSRSAM